MCNKETRVEKNISDDGEMVIHLDDILTLGKFDGTHDAVKDLTCAFTYITPSTWTAEFNKKGEIKRVCFFEQNKLDMINKELKPSKKNALVSVKKGECWVTYHQEADDGLHVGFACIPEEEYLEMEAKLAMSHVHCVAIGIDKDGELHIPEEAPVDADFLKYLFEAMGE